jgi:hypothetical protein
MELEMVQKREFASLSLHTCCLATRREKHNIFSLHILLIAEIADVGTVMVKLCDILL